MKKDKSRNHLEFLFLFVYGIWFTVAYLNQTLLTDYFPYTPVRKFTYMMVYAVLAFNLIFDKKIKRSRYFLMIAFLILFLVIRITAQNERIIVFAALIVCARNVDYRKILKVAMTVMTVVFLVTMAAVVIHYFNDSYGIVNEVGAKGTRLRYYLGYRYFFYPSYATFFIMLMHLAIKKTFQWYECLVWVLVNGFFFVFTYTQTTLALALMVLAYQAIRKRLPESFPFAIGKFFAILSPWVAAAVSVFAHYFYNGGDPRWVRINDILSDRLRLGNLALSTYNFPWLGQKIKWMGNSSYDGFADYVYVDNFYLKYGLSFGIIYVVLVVAGFSYLIYKSYKLKQTGFTIALLALLVFGLVDAEMADLRYQPFAIFMGTFFAGSTSLEKNDPGMTGKDLLILLKSKSKVIIACGLLAAVIIGGISAYDQYGRMTRAREKYPDGIKEFTITLDDEEKAAVINYINTKNMCGELDDNETKTLKWMRRSMTKKEIRYVKKYYKQIAEGKEITPGDTITYYESRNYTIEYDTIATDAIKGALAGIALISAIIFFIYAFAPYVTFKGRKLRNIN